MIPLLQLHDVSKIYGAGPARVVAVNHVSLSIQAGEVVLILGPSGSGKTTLLSMMGGLLRPTAEEVILAGRELYHLADHELSRVRCTQIGYIFQSFNLLNFLTVQQNVEVVLRLAGRGGRQVAKRAHMVLSQVHLERRLGFAPEHLSGGERQRVSIARALANAPRLILADEPTGNLDSVNGQQIGALLRELAHQGGAAVVVVTHDQRLEPIADRRLYVEDGAIREAAVVGGDHFKAGARGLQTSQGILLTATVDAASAVVPAGFGPCTTAGRVIPSGESCAHGHYQKYEG